MSACVNRPVVVVGAGPAGCATAIRLARIPNVQVKLLERRTLKAVLASADSTLAYSMLVMPRAMDTLSALNIDLPSTSIPFEGFRSITNARDIEPGSNGTGRYSLVTRANLTLDLLNVAAKEPNISIYFGTSPEAINTSNRQLTVQRVKEATFPDSENLDASARVLALESNTPSGDSKNQVDVDKSDALPTVIDYGLLIGADGAGSKVRGLLQEKGQVKVSCVYKTSVMGYKTYSNIAIPEDLPEDDAFPFATITEKPMTVLSFAKSKNLGFFTLMFRPKDGRLSGILAGQSIMLRKTVLSVSEVTDILKTEIPDWLASSIAHQIVNQTSARSRRILVCDRFHGEGGTVIIGDAAHAMTAASGQGCNSAIQSVQVLGDLVEECISSKGDLQEVPGKFTAAWMPRAHAVQILDRMAVATQGGACDPDVEDMPGYSTLFSGYFYLAATAWSRLQKKMQPSRPDMNDMVGSKPYTELVAYINSVGAAGSAMVAGSGLAAVAVLASFITPTLQR